jgi:hypothetical protein
VQALVALVIALSAVVLWVWRPDPPGTGWVADLGCSEGPLSHYQPGAYLYPYGQVGSCEVLDRKALWFSDVDASTYLLLDTDRGPVGVRVDYRNHELGRQMTAVAIELDPTDLPGHLSAQDRAALEDAIKARGGLETEPWTLRDGVG